LPEAKRFPRVKGQEGQAAVGSPFVTISMGGEAYAQWVRRAINHARSARTEIIPLFDSSVEEPVELLREIVEEGFSAPITDKYQSVFVNGNGFVLDALSKRYGVPVAQILPTTGATSGLSLIYRAFLAAGDHVLVEKHGFDLFVGIGRSLGAEVDFFSRSGDDFAIDEDELAARLTPRTRLVVVSDLHNPSGMQSSAESLSRIADLVGRSGARLVIDEVYGDYADAAARPASAVHLSPNIIVVNSLTKSYGLSSLRCGWILASRQNLAPIRHVSDQFEFGVSKLSHAVAALVLERRDRFDRYSHDAVAAARPILDRHFAAWRRAGLVAGELPRFGCICFPELIGIVDTLKFSAWLADRFGVIVAPGEFFGDAGHVRIGFAHPPETLETGLTRFCEGLREYQEVAAARARVRF
jgi:aspartate/methionine/tyrosine aminotransferase